MSQSCWGGCEHLHKVNPWYNSKMGTDCDTGEACLLTYAAARMLCLPCKAMDRDVEV